MKYKDILTQWNELIPEVQQLQENIKNCINDDAFSSDTEKDDLRFMQKGCYEILRLFLSYLD